MASTDQVSRDIQILSDSLKGLPKEWDGKEAILSMRDAGDRNWRQMEWIGFYGEFIARPLVQGLPSFSVPGDRFGNVSFDLRGSINWDLKAHPNSASALILNDKEAVLSSIQKHQYHGFVVLAVECSYDDDEGAFKYWHDALKGGTSQYEKDRVARGAPSRRRKTAARLTAIHFLVVDEPKVSIFSGAQKGWRNSDGSARREKFSLTHEKLIAESVTVQV
jgi:hypothetical protein